MGTTRSLAMRHIAPPPKPRIPALCARVWPSLLEVKPAELTGRYLDVAQMAFEGMTTRHIARELGMSIAAASRLLDEVLPTWVSATGANSEPSGPGRVGSDARSYPSVHRSAWPLSRFT